MYVNTTAEVKAETDYCVTSSNAVAVVEHIYREHGADTEILFGPDMFLGAYVEKRDGQPDARLGRRVPRPRRHPPARHRRRCAPRIPGADFLIHPECGCSTSVMEYVAAGDVDPRGRAHALDRRDARLRARRAQPGTTAIVATETGMLHPLRMAAPDVDFVAANEAASCRYMKMITLPKLRDALRDGTPVVKVPAAIAERARRADRADGRDRAVAASRQARLGQRARARARPPRARRAATRACARTRPGCSSARRPRAPIS